MAGEREAETEKAVEREGWGKERNKEKYLNNSLR